MVWHRLRPSRVVQRLSFAVDLTRRTLIIESRALAVPRVFPRWELISGSRPWLLPSSPLNACAERESKVRFPAWAWIWFWNSTMKRFGLPLTASSFLPARPRRNMNTFSQEGFTWGRRLNTLSSEEADCMGQRWAGATAAFESRTG